MKQFFERRHSGLVIGYVICYLLAFEFLETRKVDHWHMVHTRLDDAIPFCEYFVVPYLLWFVYVGAAWIYFLCAQKNMREYWQLTISLGIGMTLFLVVSWLYPNGHNLRPELPADGNFFVQLVCALYRVDTSTNILPSIHVFNSLAVAVAIDRSEALHKHWLLRKTSWILAIFIILSTVFLKQHSVVDVIFGIVLYGCVFFLVYLRGALLPFQRVQPRRRDRIR